MLLALFIFMFTFMIFAGDVGERDVIVPDAGDGDDNEKDAVGITQEELLIAIV